MSDNLPPTRDADDATHDAAPPTDAVSDEVKADAAGVETGDDVSGEVAPGPGGSDGASSDSAAEAAHDAAAATDEAERSDADIPGIPDQVGTDERLPGADASSPADAS